MPEERSAADPLEKHRAAAGRFRRQLELDSAATQRMQPASKTLATEILAIDSEGGMDLRFSVDPALGNFFGGIQGGVFATLIDEACAYAVVAAVGIHCFLGTAELHTRIFGKAPVGPIQAKARITALTRYAAHADAELFSSGRKVAAGSAIILLDTSRPINEKWVVDPDKKT